jgi:hypothetical protein
MTHLGELGESCGSRGCFSISVNPYAESRECHGTTMRTTSPPPADTLRLVT